MARLMANYRFNFNRIGRIREFPKLIIKIDLAMIRGHFEALQSPFWGVNLEKNPVFCIAIYDLALFRES
jgi:hypothetical protein